MISMTGHGRGEARAKAWTAVVECFSVNRKNAEVVFHAERAAAWLDPIVRERVLAVISRGRVQVNLTLVRGDGVTTGLLDRERAAAFLKEARSLQKELDIPGELTISDVLAAPGVIGGGEMSGQGVREVVLLALDQALKGLLETRCREGEALKKILAKSIGRVATLAKKISPLARKAPAHQRETLLRKIEAAGLPISAEDPRIAMEVAIFSERCDITEELDRITSHIAQFREKLSAEGAVGRTMEFLTQEFGREFNTVGSKSADAAISRLVIEAKSELDRLREQLANIE